MHHRAGDFFAFVHHASSIALTESRKTLETQGLRAHQTRFFTHTLWRRAISNGFLHTASLFKSHAVRTSQDAKMVAVHRYSYGKIATNDLA
jgi:hypothetical protein